MALQAPRYSEEVPRVIWQPFQAVAAPVVEHAASPTKPSDGGEDEKVQSILNVAEKTKSSPSKHSRNGLYMPSTCNVVFIDTVSVLPLTRVFYIQRYEIVQYV